VPSIVVPDKGLIEPAWTEGRFGGQTLTRPYSRQQPISVDWARGGPAGGMARGKSEKAIIIFGVADQNHRLATGGVGGIQCGMHEPTADARALSVGVDCDRAYQYQRDGAAVGHELDRPALDRSDQSSLLDRSKAKAGERGHSFA